MKLNKDLINKLKNEEVAIDNTGNPNVELLRGVLKEAFPDDKDNALGNNKYYYKSMYTKIFLSSSVKPNLPTIPLNDFLEKEFILPEKWCLERNNENYKIVNGYFNKINNTTAFFESSLCVFSDSIIVSNNKENYTEITFEQFKEHVLKQKPMKEQFPKDDFGVIVENNNGREIIDYLVSKGFCKETVNGNANNNDFYYILKNKNTIANSLTGVRNYKNLTSKTYTLQQLKNLENNMENKEIIGYKCPTDLFKGTVKKGTIYTNKISVLGQLYYPEYEKALTAVNNQKGVATEIVETWEPVYKSKEVVITMGNSFDLIIKDGKVWHEKEDITNYVIGVHGWYMSSGALQTRKINNHDFIVKDIILSKTGCKSTDSSINNWLLVFDELQKQK